MTAITPSWVELFILNSESNHPVTRFFPVPSVMEEAYTLQRRASVTFNNYATCMFVELSTKCEPRQNPYAEGKKSGNSCLSIYCKCFAHFNCQIELIDSHGTGAKLAFPLRLKCNLHEFVTVNIIVSFCRTVASNAIDWKNLQKEMQKPLRILATSAICSVNSVLESQCLIWAKWNKWAMHSKFHRCDYISTWHITAYRYNQTNQGAMVCTGTRMKDYVTLALPEPQVRYRWWVLAIYQGFKQNVSEKNDDHNK